MSFTKEQINAAALELYGASATYDPAQVTRALEAAALSSPPADDVRQALHEVVKKFAYRPTSEATDAILSDPRFEVLLRGTVTDADRDAEAKVEWVARRIHGQAPHIHEDDTGAWMDLARAVVREARS